MARGISIGRVCSRARRSRCGRRSPPHGWAFAAPAIAGLPGWSDHDAVALLTTGRRLTGYTPKAPMPPFRLSRADADAVIAFLRSLP
jgi:hypothetical protein